MGLFDYIRCQMPLPSDPAPPKVEWMQTKDTPEQYLDSYTIAADGRLIWHKCMRLGCEDDVEIKDFHGDLSFGDFDTETGENWTYVARFTEGRCVRVWLEEYEFVRPFSPSPSDEP